MIHLRTITDRNNDKDKMCIDIKIMIVYYIYSPGSTMSISVSKKLYLRTKKNDIDRLAQYL